LSELQDELKAAGADELIGTFACVYATGSVARGEASVQSDLDLFIISRTAGDQRLLSRLDSIRLESRLIEATRVCNFPDFSGDGEYLVVHDLDQLLQHLGTREDEHTNVFTARLLLLLESYPILGKTFYRRAVRTVIDRYWRDHPKNQDSFLPVFLINDIIRYWKVLCVSYEASANPPREPEISKRRLSNYKLKHSRLLICYSAIVYLCWVLQCKKTVRPEDAVEMTELRPLERLQRIAEEWHDPQTADAVERCVECLLASYARFMDETARPKTQARFESDDYHKARRDEARQFGDAMYDLLGIVTTNTDIDRYLKI